MAQHDWIPTTLNHGTLQCRRCHCTDREAAFVLGMECKVGEKLPPPFRVIEGDKK